MKRARFGTSSEKLGTRLEQLELAIEALEVDEAERLAGTPVVAEAREAARLKPARRDLPAHLPRESVVHAGPCACPACGGSLRRIGEDVTESLDYVPGRFKVVRHVREAFACRACEQVVQAPAPTMRFPRRAGPGLLAHIAVAKFDDHLPLYRQAEIYARDGVDLATSRLSGWLGATAATLQPLTELLRREVIGASDVLHGDDTPIPVLAPGTGKTSTGRLWTYVRDERPHGAPVRRRPCSSPRPTVEASARSRTWRPSPACWWPTAMPASTGCTRPGEWARPDRGGVLGARAPQDLRRARRDGLGSRGGGAGADRGALRGRARPARQAARCAHPRAADRSKPLAEALKAFAETSLAQVPGRSAWPRGCATCWHAGRRSCGPSTTASRPRQQRGRAGAALCGGRAQELPVRGIRAGRRACGGVLHPDRDGQDERARSGGLPARRAHAHRRSPGQATGRSAALELDANQ